jgi:hypothetical protein
MKRQRHSQPESLNGDVQQLSLNLHAFFCSEIKEGRLQNPLYFTQVHEVVKERIRSDSNFRKQFDAIRFTSTSPYSGEIEYGLEYLEAIGKVKMKEGNISFL